MSEKPVILFESYPDFDGGVLAVYNELVKRGYDKKYDLVWAVYSDFNLKSDYKVVKFFDCNSQEKQNIIRRTKCIIDSNRYIQKFSPNVYRLFLPHGFSLKKCSNYNRSIGSVDAIVSTSEEMLKLDRKIWPDYVKDKFIITGMPNMDILFHPKNLYDSGLIRELTGSDKKFHKIIGWLPTYREHRCWCKNKNDFKYGLPTIQNYSDYEKLNDILKKNDDLLIIEMHHAQAKNYQKLNNCSNIIFTDISIRSKYKISIADMLGNFDALLTDYSSVYHAYVILNKPIGLIIPDLPLYAKVHGFSCNYLDWVKGDYILDNSDLYEWLENVSKNIDSSKAQREICLNKIHKYKDDEWNGIRAKVAGTPMEQMAYNPVISITFGDQSKRFTDVYDKFDFKAAMDKFFADHPDYNK